MAETDVRSNRFSRQMGYVHCFADKVKRFPGLARRETWKVGKDDPRRVVHAFKVGIALTIVSLLYLMEPLFKGIGQNAMWAVMTVVVVMEFTVGATLSKGLNRGLGTLLAASLAFLTEYIADAPGQIFRAVFIAVAVFIIGTMTSYVRFIPYIKKNYDYGVLIFLLTIAIGCAICLVMSILVFPNWSGEDLHNNTVSRLEGLANSIQVCVREYFNDSEESACQDDSSEDPIYKGYKTVLDSKTTDDTLALQASWEPRYLRYCHRIPWHQYAKVGAALRYFSYTVVALHGCLQSEIQTPKSIRALYKDSCIRLGEEVSKVLRELAKSIRNNRKFCPEILSNNLKEALQNLNSALKSQPQLILGSRNSRATNTPVQAVQHHDQKLEEDTRTSLPGIKNTGSSSRLGCRSREQSRELTKKVLRTQLSKVAIVSLEFSEALPFAAFTSLLVEMVAKLDRVMDEVEDLGRMAQFSEYEDDGNDHKIVVTCENQSGVASAGSE
ncbi:aluminum-activated malate transporter 12-like [Vigna unguiculata]|uniref:aluminum-activated malate transporter 12-like n=1 Tax=Vigna unguiculata TaxID=3917 RepID=UPI0010170AFF|nr:aluminum-activated malate transporter 12-like [Vigna unguiculata]